MALAPSQQNHYCNETTLILKIGLFAFLGTAWTNEVGRGYKKSSAVYVTNQHQLALMIVYYSVPSLGIQADIFTSLQIWKDEYQPVFLRKGT